MQGCPGPLACHGVDDASQGNSQAFSFLRSLKRELLHKEYAGRSRLGLRTDAAPRLSVLSNQLDLAFCYINKPSVPGSKLYAKRARLLKKQGLTPAQVEALQNTQCFQQPDPEEVEDLLLKLEAFKAEHGKYPTTNKPGVPGRELYAKRAVLLKKQDLTTAQVEALKHTQCFQRQKLDTYDDFMQAEQQED